MEWMTIEQDRRISTVVKAEGGRLRNFIRKHVADEADAEDILQEVFYEFVQTYRLMKPIEQAGAWLFRVARNRIIDRFRKRRHDPLEAILQSEPTLNSEGDRLTLDDLLPSPDADPEAIYLRTLLIDALEDAIDELPEEQRAVFIAHEIDGRSFKEMAEETGTNLNTLLARKRYAVRHLRSSLQNIYDEFTRL
jgi:RNA polymerase sigma factor (sigma-70 family)